jgi:hypothetical protein
MMKYTNLELGAVSFLKLFISAFAWRDSRKLKNELTTI